MNIIDIAYFILGVMTGFCIARYNKTSVSKIYELIYKNNIKNGGKKVTIRKRSPADFEPHEWEIICQRVAINENKKIDLNKNI